MTPGPSQTEREKDKKGAGDGHEPRAKTGVRTRPDLRASGRARLALGARASCNPARRGRRVVTAARVLDRRKARNRKWERASEVHCTGPSNPDTGTREATTPQPSSGAWGTMRSPEPEVLESRVRRVAAFTSNNEKPSYNPSIRPRDPIRS